MWLVPLFSTPELLNAVLTKELQWGEESPRAGASWFVFSVRSSLEKHEFG